MAPKAPELCSAAAEAVARAGKLTDCKLVAADGSSYEVSKAALAIHSKVLGSMFNDLDLMERTAMLDDSPADATCLVNHCYAGDDFLIDNDNLLSCSRMADKYDIPRLQRAISKFVQHLQFSPDNLPCYIVLAHGHPSLGELKERCMTYAAKRLQHVLDLRKADKHTTPTDWLKSLPKSALIDLMQRRCRVLCAFALVSEKVEEGQPFNRLTDEEVARLESGIKA